MKQILLTQGQVAFVDDADYEELSKHKWFAEKHRSGNFYAVRGFPLKNGKQRLIRMHRQILRLEFGDKRQGDHINHNTLDNHQDNLRICTNQQNTTNKKIRLNTTSRFKGVYWNKLAKKWHAQIGIDGKRKHLGFWKLEELAALTYDFAAMKYHYEFAVFNF